MTTKGITRKQPQLHEIYVSLFETYGPQNWWPARTRAEMMLGAILTQNTAWTNVEKAISSLRKSNALNFLALQQLPNETIAGLIRPAGYFNQKAKCIKSLCEMLENYEGSLNKLFRLPTPELRQQLLSVRGIGPETADCILLYAAGRPLFVVDTYTRRLLAAYGFPEESRGPYNSIAALFTSALPADVQLFNEYHALIVRWGKDH